MSIFITSDGSHSVFNEPLGVSYHSKHGAIQETNHVFIGAGLRFKAVVQQELRILETGFGTGLNAYMTLLEAQRRNLNIFYESWEAYPLIQAQWQQLNYPMLLEPDAVNPLFEQFHEVPWETPVVLSESFTLLKRKGPFHAIAHQESFDLIYFDAFAPDAQPDLWTPELLAKMFEALKPEGALVTYCAKGYVKRNLKQVGFTVETLPGPPFKREMIRACKPS